jgi:hypothetical protein
MCGKVLNIENQSIEHIFPNSIGGRLTSSSLICKECNSNFGNRIDSKLSSQLNFFANILMIKRKRGNPQPELMENEKTGEKYFLDHEGIPSINKPSFEATKIADKLNFKITARNKEEARKILKNLSKKYKNINVEELLNKAENYKTEIDEPLQKTITVGGKDFLPAILKIALNFYIYKTGDILSVKYAVDDLKKEKTDKVEPIVLNYRLFDLENEEVSHSIYLRASQTEHKLYAIIELFNVFQFIVKLSDNYDMPDFEEIYVYDILLCTTKSKMIKHYPDFSFIFNFLYPESNPNFQIYQNALNRLFSIAMGRQHSAHLKKIVTTAWDEVISSQIPEGGILTSEVASSFSKRVAEDFIKLAKKLAVFEKTNDI